MKGVYEEFSALKAAKNKANMAGFARKS